MYSENKIQLDEIIENADKTRIKLSKIGTALLKHLEKFDDVIKVSDDPKRPHTPSRGDL